MFFLSLDGILSKHLVNWESFKMLSTNSNYRMKFIASLAKVKIVTIITNHTMNYISGFAIHFLLTVNQVYF